jgi:hypothetical protein
MKKYKYLCPTCNKELIYNTAQARWSVQRASGSCKECLKKGNNIHTLYRNCNKCGCKKTYNSYVAYFNAGVDVTCRHCASENCGFLDRYATKGHNTGEKNAWYGKHHTEISKQKIRDNKTYDYVTDEFRQKMSKMNSGVNGSMYGKKVFPILVQKYGEVKANEIWNIKREKARIRMLSDLNPQRGKPPHQGSGNGWKGWYKGWFFRSIRELSYMINVIEYQNLVWRTAETNDLQIPYIGYNNTNRIYRADFLINEKILVEVKPKQLHNTCIVNLKKHAAIEYCKTRNLEYEIIDPPLLTTDQLIILYKDNKIQFMDKYEQKFKKRFIK